MIKFIQIFQNIFLQIFLSSELYQTLLLGKRGPFPAKWNKRSTSNDDEADYDDDDDDDDDGDEDDDVNDDDADDDDDGDGDDQLAIKRVSCIWKY